MTDTAQAPLEDAEEAMVRRVASANPAALLVAAAIPLLVVLGEVTVIETLRFRSVMLGLALALAFLTLRPRHPRAALLPYLLGLAAFGVSLAIAILGRSFLSRASEPTPMDLGLGAALLVLVLAGTWLSTGAVLPVVGIIAIAYVLWGSELDAVGLSLIAHRGYDLPRLVGSMVMGFEGVFGVPLDVAATTIGLFALYGALLEASGAARFFLDLAFAAFSGGGTGRGAGRAVTFAGFLLGSVSGSGVATTLTLGGAAAPLLRRSGFSRENAGALLAASGIGAILSPPTLGAAAFLIAEYLKIPYGRVLLMATIPTLLYYFGILMMIEADAPSKVEAAVESDGESPGSASVRQVLRRGGHHLVSPLLVVVFLLLGYSATRSALAASIGAFALSSLDPAHALTPHRLRRAAIAAGASLVPVLTTTACAGILVAALTLTGLGLKVAGLIVSLAGGNAIGVILLSAFAVAVLGLSVPVTASYILAAVTIAPALVQVGVPELAAHMFIFYYAVLSEVSPPTALSPMAAATICHGDPYRTVLATLRYTLPAFLVPLLFTLRADGAGLLLQGSWLNVASAAIFALAAIVAAAAAASGFLLRPLGLLARVLFGGLAMAFFSGSSVLSFTGLALLAAALLRLRTERSGARA